MWVLEPTREGVDTQKTAATTQAASANSVHYLLEGTFAIGRPPKAGTEKAAEVLVHGDASVSKTHAKIAVSSGAPGEPQKAVVIDLSRYGTFINSERVDKDNPPELHDGDVLRLSAKTHFRLRHHQPVLLWCYSGISTVQAQLQLQQQAAAAGALLTHSFLPNVTHVLLPDGAPVTPAVLWALLSSKHIVTPGWLVEVAQQRVWVDRLPLEATHLANDVMLPVAAISKHPLAPLDELLPNDRSMFRTLHFIVHSSVQDGALAACIQLLGGTTHTSPKGCRPGALVVASAAAIDAELVQDAHYTRLRRITADNVLVAMLRGGALDGLLLPPLAGSAPAAGADVPAASVSDDITQEEDLEDDIMGTGDDAATAAPVPTAAPSTAATPGKRGAAAAKAPAATPKQPSGVKRVREHQEQTAADGAGTSAAGAVGAGLMQSLARAAPAAPDADIHLTQELASKKQRLEEVAAQQPDSNWLMLPNAGDRGASNTPGRAATQRGAVAAAAAGSGAGGSAPQHHHHRTGGMTRSAAAAEPATEGAGQAAALAAQTIAFAPLVVVQPSQPVAAAHAATSRRSSKSAAAADEAVVNFKAFRRCPGKGEGTVRAAAYPTTLVDAFRSSAATTAYLDEEEQRMARKKRDDEAFVRDGTEGTTKGRGARGGRVR